MINVIHKHGHSFKGLAQYLLHDVGAESSQRVAWTHTVNLSTDDPRVATRVMIATAQRQGELKAAAGVPKTGRKSAKHVMHYTLSWHREEQGELTKEDMLQAALASLEYLGTKEGEVLGQDKHAEPIVARRTQFADEHQAVIVCHEGELGDDGQPKAPHVHLMLNRVHPERGVMLPDHNDYRRLSRWALDYREAQGRAHYCPKRVHHAALRAQGYATSDRRKSRQQYELEKAQRLAKEQSRDADAERIEALRQKVADLASQRAAMRTKHREAIHALEDKFKAQQQRGRDETAAKILAARRELLASYKPREAALLERQAAERGAFEEAQKTLKGRVAEGWKAVTTKEWMRDELRTRPLHAMKDAFTLAFSSGLQRQQLDRFHRREAKELLVERKAQERLQARGLRARNRAVDEQRRARYITDRIDLLLMQRMEAAKLRAEWRSLQSARRGVVVSLAASPRQPGRGADRDAQVFIDRMRARREERRRDRDRDRGR